MPDDPKGVDGGPRSRLLELEFEIDTVKTKIQSLRSQLRCLEDEKKSLEEIIKEQIVRKDGSDFKGSSFPWSNELLKILRERFKLKSFRGLQEVTINCILSGKDCILIMPTGGGKSLTFQLPCAFRKGLTIVVCPLVSLMEDQVMQMRAKCPDLPVATLHSQLARADSSAILKSMTFPPGSPDSLLLYVTPERLAKSKLFMTKLQKCYEASKLRLIAIDEVHCCSQWGHDFRVDYVFLGILKKQFAGVPILGLTATASQHIVNDVTEMLGLDEETILLRDSFDRPNLRYSVVFSDRDPIEMIGSAIKDRYRKKSGIIYCFSCRESEEIAKRLNSDYGVAAAAYNANLESTHRSAVHRRWSAGKLQVVVATVAFGMGIDKPDVAFVFHYSIPKSMENYYQESGRAGRDGEPADCVLYLRFQDIFRQASMVFSEKAGIKNLCSVVLYCLDESRCRRGLLARHFCEGSISLKCEDDDNRCDNCRSDRKVHPIDISSHVKLMSQAIEEAQLSEVRLTGNKLVESLRKKIKSISKERLERLVAWCFCKGYLELKYHFTPYSTIPFFTQAVLMSDVSSGNVKALFETSDTSLIPAPHPGTSRAPKRKRNDNPSVICIDDE